MGYKNGKWSGLGLEPLLKTMYHSCNDYCTNIIAFVGRGESSDEHLCDAYLLLGKSVLMLRNSLTVT
ncbi:hypothetical protein CEP54_006982 [Fusarium duplospermum]|uniref:Uncharacterized protein n=1 Tax=Fusarium duplospermum TaxID=1325734 RepID=A0A428Q423_9HYPO|nr:hypothetical protein CEP54_006982 [Fusarium duplospermum]